jgi:hypothetical protein
VGAFLILPFCFCVAGLGVPLATACAKPDATKKATRLLTHVASAGFANLWPPPATFAASIRY